MLPFPPKRPVSEVLLPLSFAMLRVCLTGKYDQERPLYNTFTVVS